MIGSVATVWWIVWEKFLVQALKAAILEITDPSGELFSPPLASNVAPEAGKDQNPGLYNVKLEIHLIKNLQGSVEMDFNPAGSLLDRLPVVVRAPTLYERQPRQKL